MAQLFRVEMRIGVVNRVLQLERVTAQMAMALSLFKMALHRPS